MPEQELNVAGEQPILTQEQCAEVAVHDCFPPPAGDLVNLWPPVPAPGRLILGRQVRIGRGEEARWKTVAYDVDTSRAGEHLFRRTSTYYWPESDDPNRGSGQWYVHQPALGVEHVPVSRRDMLLSAIMLATVLSGMLTRPLRPQKLGREILEAAESKPWPAARRGNEAIRWVREFLRGYRGEDGDIHGAGKSSQLPLLPCVDTYCNWLDTPVTRARRAELRTAIEGEFHQHIQRGWIREDKHLGARRSQWGWWGLKTVVPLESLVHEKAGR